MPSKKLGAVRFPDTIFDLPDTILFIACSTAGAAIDIPSGTQWLRITALSTGASPVDIHPFLSMGSTGAGVPTTGQSSGSSAHVRVDKDRVYPVGGSTELSLICQDSSGHALIDCWA